MTRRERLEARLQRREEWAAKRQAKASRSFSAARAAVEGIEPGQPILVGHHSEARHRRALDRCDNAATVEAMRGGSFTFSGGSWFGRRENLPASVLTLAEGGAL